MGRIIVTLDVVMARRKMRLNRLAELTAISAVNLSLLKNGHARAIRFSTLLAICEALDCVPADILDYESDSNEADAADHDTPEPVNRGIKICE